MLFYFVLVAIAMHVWWEEIRDWSAPFIIFCIFILIPGLLIWLWRP